MGTASSSPFLLESTSLFPFSIGVSLILALLYVNFIYFFLNIASFVPLLGAEVFLQMPLPREDSCKSPFLLHTDIFQPP